jgi:cytochrome P450
VTATPDSRSAVPEVDFDHQEGHLPVGTYHRRYDELRAQHAAFRSTTAGGFWVMTQHENILDTFQHPELFSSRAVSVTEPNPEYLWIPEMLDPPIHTKWRKLLGPFFSPGRIEKMQDRVRQRCIELVEECSRKREIDFLADFAGRYPTTIFLELMGLPVSDLDQFMVWEDLILHGSSESDPDRSKSVAAMGEVKDYFGGLLQRRREEPLDDLISAAVRWEIDGRLIPEQELRAFCLLMFMAGLDTVAMQLCWSWLHLATHPADRERIVAEPGIIPLATEELLRVYSFVLPARTATQDVNWHGCPMKAGDMVLLPLNSSTRDESQRPQATSVVLDRSPNPHLAFGAGPHRCLGSHLARQELVIAMQEWHRRIPSYRLADDARIIEHGRQLGVDSLPLILG